jgi:deoxyribodipyrimidine photo-lyase
VQENSKQDIAIVWFKRDIRFTDHEPLYFAHKQQLPILLIYCFEPSIMNYVDSDVRHWRFVYQSIQDMQNKLIDYKTSIAVFNDEAHHVFQKIQTHYNIKIIFSHQEIGNQLTYSRDLVMKKFCVDNSIEWKEYQHNGVIRKLKSRKDWEKRWKEKMQETPKIVDEKKWHFLQLDPNFYASNKGNDLNSEITIYDKSFQMGGETFAWKYLNNFLLGFFFFDYFLFHFDCYFSILLTIWIELFIECLFVLNGCFL